MEDAYGDQGGFRVGEFLVRKSSGVQHRRQQLPSGGRCRLCRGDVGRGLDWYACGIRQIELVKEAENENQCDQERKATHGRA